VVGAVTPRPTLVPAFSIFPTQCAGYDLRPGRRILTGTVVLDAVVTAPQPPSQQM
jgi:hypothetical protein